ncbi:MAG: Gfo/Idh/MocA family oxidoreductase [Clostridia bacterium]|nr:Gfo/Idh/MocA family oxidoreductase [Clostridia bacterium]
MKNKVKTAVVGLGGRGFGLLDALLVTMDNVEITAVCDLYPDRLQAGVDSVVRAYGEDHRPFATTDYRDFFGRDDIEAILVLCAWEAHFPIAIDAMEHGIPVAMEVGGAYTIDDCWRLVRTYEKTKTPFMFLENCCYGEAEMLVMNMVKQGLFGEIIHCEGGYRHDLRSEIIYGKENRHYRLHNYLNRNCENYPTHELGPIAQILNINRGNRFLSLNAISSKAAGLNAFAAAHPDANQELATARFAQGDVVTTVITCAHGETITLTLDTTLPRAYSRGFTVQGTKGMYMEDNRSIFLDSDHGGADHWDWSPEWNNQVKYLEKYSHPTWVDYHKNGIRGGHGGMDGLVFDAFIECIRLGRPCPIDVYDAVAWMAVTPLSEESIAKGGAPVAFPDFTSGAWCTRKNED